MTTELVAWLAFAATLALLGVAMGCNALLREDNRRLRASALDSLRQVAYWRDKATTPRYREPVFETPAEHFRRMAMERHAAEAVERLRGELDEWGRA